MGKKRGAATDEGSIGIAERLARLRKDRGLTQEELAKALGVSQPVVSDYERGGLRLHGELIIRLAEILQVSADEILGLKPAGKEGRPKHRRLLRRLEKLDHLSKRDQDAVLRMLDAFLAKP